MPWPHHMNWVLTVAHMYVYIYIHTYIYGILWICIYVIYTVYVYDSVQVGPASMSFLGRWAVLGIDMTALRGQDPEDKVASCLGSDDERRQWLSTIQQWAKEPRTEQAGCVRKWGVHPPICINLWRSKTILLETVLKNLRIIGFWGTLLDKPRPVATMCHWTLGIGESVLMLKKSGPQPAKPVRGRAFPELDELDDGTM